MGFEPTSPCGLPDFEFSDEMVKAVSEQVTSGQFAPTKRCVFSRENRQKWLSSRHFPVQLEYGKKHILRKNYGKNGKNSGKNGNTRTVRRQINSKRCIAMELESINWDSVPETISKEELYKICHISKQTARYLLQSGKIPCECSGKKTRCYKIKKEDVIKSNQYFPFAVAFAAFTADIVLILQRFHNSLDRSNRFSGCFNKLLLFHRRILYDQF